VFGHISGLVVEKYFSATQIIVSGKTDWCGIFILKVGKFVATAIDGGCLLQVTSHSAYVHTRLEES
jgi:hypothetical protein